MPKKKLLLIIVHYSGFKDTLECLCSLKKAGLKDGEILLVNNGSSDFDKRKLNKEFPDLILLNSKENLGFSGGNNLGIKYALSNSYDYLILLNNDTLVPENFKKKIKQVLPNFPEKFIFSPKIFFAKGYEFHKKRYKKYERGKVIWYAGGLIDWKNVYGSHRGVNKVDVGLYQKQEKTDFATGCCMLAPILVFQEVGLFDDNYFLYFEDSDFCQRAKSKNIGIYFVPEIHLWHKNASSSEGAGGQTSYYYQTRNRFIFGLKYASLKTKAFLLKQAINFLLSKDKIKKKAASDFLSLKWGRREFKK